MHDYIYIYIYNHLHSHARDTIIETQPVLSCFLCFCCCFPPYLCVYMRHTDSWLSFFFSRPSLPFQCILATWLATWLLFIENLLSAFYPLSSNRVGCYFWLSVCRPHALHMSRISPKKEQDIGSTFAWWWCLWRRLWSWKWSWRFLFPFFFFFSSLIFFSIFIDSFEARRFCLIFFVCLFFARLLGEPRHQYSILLHWKDR